MCFFWIACPLPGKLARVGGHRRQPVLIRRCTRHLMPGILDRMACGVALALAIEGVSCAADPPRGKKAALFWGVLDVHKTSQIPSKIALGRGRFGARGGSLKAEHQGEICFLVIFRKFLMLHFLCKNSGTCIKHRKYRQKMKLRTRLELRKLPCFWRSKDLKI